MKPVRPLLLPSVLVAALAAAGCSTPPVARWSGGDPAAAGSSMPGALRYLDAARSKYREAVADQLDQERALTGALVGAGALVAALAVGNAHRDAIVGTSVAAGTGYALGNIGLQRPRVLIYQAGVEALNCAERAVAPFAIDAAELEALRKSLDALEAARMGLSAALAAGKPLRRNAQAGSGEADRFDGAATLAVQALQASEATLKAGREFGAAASRGARELVAAVNGIDAAVVRSVITATPDLSSVPKLVSGLAGMIGSFAPGAGLEALVQRKLESVATTKTGVEGKSALEQAADDVIAAAADVAARNAEAGARLAGRAASWPEDAFEDCGVAQVVAPLAVAPAALQFTAGRDARRVIDIAGGVKPYFVEVDGTAVDGLAIKPPIRFDSRAEVSVEGARVIQPVETALRVSDSSPTARTLSIPLAVVAAASAPAGAGPAAAATGTGSAAAAAGTVGAGPTPPKPSTNAAASTVDADLARLKQKSRFSFRGKAFVLTALPKRVGDAIEVRVKCPEGNTDTFKRSELARALLAEAGLSEPPARKITVVPDPPACAPE